MLWEILFCFLWGFVVAQMATLVTTVYLHRGSTHKAVDFNPVVEFFFQLVLWLTTGINRKEWVAVHLCHHAHTDVEGDTHSPVLLGFWKVQLWNVLLYRKAAKDPEVMWYGRNIKLSWAERNLFRSTALGLSVGVGIACFVFSFWQGLAVSLFHTVLYLQLNSLINAYCHVRGYKNFPEAHAFNSRLVALITGGEGNHNNHHKYPSHAKLAIKPFESDFGWYLILGLVELGLAEIKD